MAAELAIVRRKLRYAKRSTDLFHRRNLLAIRGVAAAHAWYGLFKISPRLWSAYFAAWLIDDGLIRPAFIGHGKSLSMVINGKWRSRRRLIFSETPMKADGNEHRQGDPCFMIDNIILYRLLPAGFEYTDLESLSSLPIIIIIYSPFVLYSFTVYPFPLEHFFVMTISSFPCIFPSSVGSFRLK